MTKVEVRPSKGVFISPNWGVVSEVWIERMIEAFGSDYLDAVIVLWTPVNTTFQGIPVRSLLTEGNWTQRFAATIRPKRLRQFLLKTQKKHSLETLRKILEEIEPEFVFANFLNATISFRSVLEKLDCPVFIHGHGFDCFPDLKANDGSERRCYPESYREELITSTDWAWIVANSGFTKQALVDLGLQEKRILVKNFGVVLPQGKLPRFSETEPLRLIALGRLVDFKGGVEIVKACSHAFAQGLNATLTIVGDGPERKRVEEAINESSHRDQFEMKGEMSPEQCQAQLASHHVFVAHSKVGDFTGQAEAFGVAYIEAMSYGLPVVGTNFGGPSEIVEHGSSGLLSSPGDIAAQANNLLLLGDVQRWEEMSQKSRDIVRTRYNVEQEQQFLRRVVTSR